jgi:hypothetical protein
MDKQEIARQIVKEYFKDDFGKPIILSDGQCDVFNAIFLKEHSRIQVIAPTQYGKSNTIAMALILRTQAFGEEFAIVTGQEKKSQIIMEKVIQHTFDDKRLYSQLEIDRNEPLERIKRERSKQRITWKCGGGIRTYTADSRNRRRVIDALTGLGSPNIIEDEASLIPDDLQVMILRMLGGYGGGFLMKIGNPFTTGHFKKTWNSEKYRKVFIDYHQGLKEGRYTPEFIEEMRAEPFFDILYECKFPAENNIDQSGYYRLLTDTEISEAKADIKPEGEWKLGFDPGEGGDENVGVLRCRNFAKVVHRSRVEDLMAQVKIIDDLIKQYGLKPENVSLDANGIGAGIEDRLKEIGLDVNGVKWSEQASNPEKYANLKAENYWDLRVWVKEVGKLEKNDGFNELSVIKYKEDTSGKLKIKPKEEMRKEGIKSPNVADALALTFNETKQPEIFFI